MLSTTDAFFKNNQDANQLARISYLFTNPHISSLDASAAQQNKEDLKNIGKFFSYLITSIIDLRGDQIKAPSKLAMPHDIQDDRWRSTMLLIIIEQNSKKYHKHSVFKIIQKVSFYNIASEASKCFAPLGLLWGSDSQGHENSTKTFGIQYQKFYQLRFSFT